MLKREEVKAKKRLKKWKKKMRRRTSVVKRPRDVDEHTRQQKVWKLMSKNTIKGRKTIFVPPVASSSSQQRP